MKWITLKKFTEISGITEESIRALKKSGQLRQNIHWCRGPNGRIFISPESVDRWIEGKTA